MDTFREWFDYSWVRVKCQMWIAKMWFRDTFLHGAILSTEGSNLHQQVRYTQSENLRVQSDTIWCQREIITEISTALVLNRCTCPSVYLSCHKTRNWYDLEQTVLHNLPCMQFCERYEYREFQGDVRLPGLPSTMSINRQNKAASEDSSEKLAS